jgi:hypothetical protein
MTLLSELIMIVFFQFSALAGIGGNIPEAGPDTQRATSARPPSVPDCSGNERWPTSMAFVHLKNDGITDNSKVNFNKTKTIRLASEQIERNLFRQVHHVTFTERSGKTIEVITVNDASNEECSMSAVDVYVVARHLPGK